MQAIYKFFIFYVFEYETNLRSLPVSFQLRSLWDLASGVATKNHRAWRWSRRDRFRPKAQAEAAASGQGIEESWTWDDGAHCLAFALLRGRLVPKQKKFECHVNV